MRIGKFEFGIINEPDHSISKIEWKSGKLEEFQYIYKFRKDFFF